MFCCLIIFTSGKMISTYLISHNGVDHTEIIGAVFGILSSVNDRGFFSMGLPYPLLNQGQLGKKTYILTFCLCTSNNLIFSNERIMW